VRTVNLEALPLFLEAQFIEAPAALKTPVMLSESRLKDKFWMTFLPAHNTLYVQVNEVNDKEEELLVDFAREVEEAVAKYKAERLVLDLRHNPGGNNYLARPLLLSLLRLNEINRFGQLYTLIGRETFSAAQNLVNNLEYFTTTLFVGEPTGASPNGYGDSKKFQLPNSKLTVRASSIYWRDLSADEKRPWTAPDLPVAYTSAAYFKGQDPVLDAALTFKPGELSQLMSRVYEKSGFQNAFWLYYRYRNDSRYNPAALEATEQAFGQHLLQQKKAEDAVGWYGYVSSQRPKQVWPLLGLAEAQLLDNKHSNAAEAVSKVLALDPENEDARKLQQKIGAKQ